MDDDRRDQFVRVTGLPKRITVVCAGAKHSAAVDEQRFLYTWGSGVQGQLGNGNADQPLPQLVPGFRVFLNL